MPTQGWPTWAPGSGEVHGLCEALALWLHPPRTHGARSQETMGPGSCLPGAGPGPLTPPPECPRAPEAGLTGSYPPLRQGPMLSPRCPSSRSCTGPSCPSTRGQPLRAVPALPPGRVCDRTRDRTCGSGAADRKALETGQDAARNPRRGQPLPVLACTLQAWDSTLAARPSPGPPQAYLVLGHGVQTGLVGGQHQVLLDPLVDLHQDGAVLHGAAVGGQVRLQQQAGM